MGEFYSLSTTFTIGIIIVFITGIAILVKLIMLYTTLKKYPNKLYHQHPYYLVALATNSTSIVDIVIFKPTSTETPETITYTTNNKDTVTLPTNATLPEIQDIFTQHLKDTTTHLRCKYIINIMAVNNYGQYK